MNVHFQLSSPLGCFAIYGITGMACCVRAMVTLLTLAVSLSLCYSGRTNLAFYDAFYRQHLLTTMIHKSVNCVKCKNVPR